MQPRRPGGPWMRGTVRELGSVERTYPMHPNAIRLARRVVRTACHFTRAGDAGDAAALTVSELLGNAVKARAGTHVTLRLSWTTRRLRVEVCDASPHAPLLRRAELTDEGGRGLWLVSELAVRWGVQPRSSGKCVWAEIALPAAA